jgi:hypothetical protein
MRTWLAMVTLGALLASAQPASAGERHYVIFFGSETSPKILKYTHTFATYITVVGEGPDPANYQITRVNTISFLPATLDIHVFAPQPEPAVNLDLYTTLDYVLRNGESVDCWTPMEASPEIYYRAIHQWERLMRGESLYKAIDPPNDRVYDCIHANTDIDPKFGNAHYPLIRVGKPATAYIVKQFGKRGLLTDPTQDNHWMLTRLGIDRYPVRIIKPPVRSGVAGGPCAR